MPAPQVMPREWTALETAWIAGLLEGEGCFTHVRRLNKTKYRASYPAVVLCMTDLDVVQRAAEMMNANIQRPIQRPTQTKPSWRVEASSRKGLVIMRRVRPFMGTRRGERIGDLIDRFAD